MALRVLLVQSENQAVQVLVRILKERGDQTWIASDFNQAVSMTEQVHPDLVLVDLHFPGNDWLLFLRRLRQSYPQTKIILTSKYPDLQREMAARESGVGVFTRQPFEKQWLIKAINQVYHLSGNGSGQTSSAPGQNTPRVRVPVRMKITLPYLLLALLFAVAGAYIVSQIILESAQERFYNQLVKTGKQATDWMVRQEDRQLSTLRLIANSQGVGQLILDGDAEQLRSLALPLAINADEEAVEILDARGLGLVSMRRPVGGGSGSYEFTRGETTFSSLDFVQAALQGKPDDVGDKFAGIAQTPGGLFFYISGPVFNTTSEAPVGVVLIGRSFRTLVRQMQQETLGEVSLYDFDGQPLASTLFSQQDAFPLAKSQVTQAIASQQQNSLTRELSVGGIAYSEMFGPWEARGGKDLGLIGVALTQTVLVRTSQVTQLEIFLLVAVAIMLVIMVGLLLSSMITNPLQRLVSASSQVASGNLEVKVDVRGDDEMAVLAQTFNRMVVDLQEGFIYRDLLGRTVSPEVREQLRTTFKTGDVRLEGQESVATVLMSDIRAFTTLSERASAAQVFEWLNEYFARLVPIITAHGGVVNKFDGDAMLAFFGILPTPLEPRESAFNACQAALEILDEINRYNQERSQRGLPTMTTGIGINTGVVIAGGLGSSDRMHYTIIGDTVNTTQRLEALTRQLFAESGIVIGQHTYNALDDQVSEFSLDPAGLHAVKGKVEQVLVYRLSRLQAQPRIEIML